jgi:hypothetical protein
MNREPVKRSLVDMILHRKRSGSYSPDGGALGDRPNVAENTIKTGKIQVERKTFHFALKENPRGRFLRITEEAKGKRNSIVIPATGLDEFHRLLENVGIPG